MLLLAWGLVSLLLRGSLRAQGRTFHVECRADSTSGSAPALLLRSLTEVNAQHLEPGDRLLFARGTVCRGTLAPLGSGTAEAPLRIAAYGHGALPLILAADDAPEAVRLNNQEYWEIAELEVRGGTHFGVSISGDHGTLHHLYLRDLRVHAVGGKLNGKEQGLVSIHPSAQTASFADVRLDGVQAYDTAQWVGIFIAGGSEQVPSRQVTVVNSTVHDVQGDGIVLFNVEDGEIRNSAAWHTGMQHSFSIGTPNAIWTWQCRRCVVQGNEAFLADSPGVDGGSFDIDYGNTGTRILGNFGHHTQGYCVSVFAAFGETVDSEVAGNTCLENGLSPRLAQRQGALLLMTWSHGAIRKVDIHDNTVFWTPGANTPAVQVGSGLQMTGLSLRGNHVWSASPAMLSPELGRFEAGNDWLYTGGDAGWLGAKQLLPSARRAAMACPTRPWEDSCTRSARRAVTRSPLARAAGRGAATWLVLTLDGTPGQREKDRADLRLLWGLAVQFGGSPGRFRVIDESCDATLLQTAEDWGLIANGVQLETRCGTIGKRGFAFSASQESGDGFQGPATPASLWLALARRVGAPNYSDLPVLQIEAHD